jgi:hypothetical protein
MSLAFLSIARLNGLRRHGHVYDQSKHLDLKKDIDEQTVQKTKLM